jgi:hypothetical protein
VTNRSSNTIDFRRGSDRERTGTFLEVIQIKTNRITLLAEREPIQIILEEETPTRSYTLHLVALETIRLTDRVLIVQE